MTNYNLSEGSLAIIMSGGNVDEPIMQCLGSKQIMGNADKERYRLLVSDGKYQISFAMMATQINEKIKSGELNTYAVIKVKKYITSMINNAGKGDRRVMVILDMEVIARADEVGRRIGDPIALPDDPSTVLNNKKTTNGNSSSKKPESSVTTQPSKPQNTYQPQKPVQNLPQASGNQLTVPISSLSPYQNKWVIKVRVTNKSPIRTWSNSRGEGKLFSMDLADASGEIRATVFKELVDKFYDMIEIDKVYYISKCILKAANKQFSNLDNDYEMTFGNETIVQPCFDEMSVPKAVYNFTTIDKLSNFDVGAIIDVIAVVKSCGECISFQSKANKELKKRELTLVDQSNTSVTLTLWGSEADTFDGSGQPVVAVRGAKVGEFGGGKNLSVLVSSVLKINPDLPEAHRLKGWFDNEGKNETPTNISAKSGAGIRTDWISFKEVKDRRLGSAEKGDYYQSKATILLINSTNAFYKACPSDECNKKVVDLETGQFRCEKCNREYPGFKYRLIVSMNLGDWSDNQWVSVFTSEAEKILGMTSQEVGEAHEANPESLLAITSKANFTEFVFRCRAKLETYNDETRLKNVAIKVDPINFKEYNSFLISSISEMLSL